MPRRYVVWCASLVLVLGGAGLLFPAIQKVREAASRMSCHCHNKCLTLAVHNYAEVHGMLPPGANGHTTRPPEQRLSWLVSVLPYIEQDRAFKQFDLARGPDDPQNAKPVKGRFGMFVCPSSGEHERGSGRMTWDESAGKWAYSERAEKWKSPTPLTHYIGVDAAALPLKHPRAGVFGYDRRTTLKDDIPDGTSNTLLIIETANTPGHWAYSGHATVRGFEPDSLPYIGPGRLFGGFHNGAPVLYGERMHLCVAAMADGSVRQFTSATAPEFLEALATVDGKEALPANW